MTADSALAHTTPGRIAEVFARIDAHRPVLEQTAREAEELATLPPAAVDAIRDIGVYRLKVPHELGGLAADPSTQVRVFAEISRANPSAGWCSFVGAGSANIVAGYLPDESLDEVFGADPAPSFAGIIAPAGTAAPVPGGWAVSGTWPYASGIRHADWVFVGCQVEGGGKRTALMRRTDVSVQDDWKTFGLQGTGSNSLVLEQVFVPDGFAWNPVTPPRRGGAITGMGIGGNLAPEIVGFAVGVGRRAFDEILLSARSRRRGGTKSVAERGAFQLEFARAKLTLDAAEALAIRRFDDAWSIATLAGLLSAEYQNELRAIATYAVNAALDAIRAVWPFMGASELDVDKPLQRCLRDLTAASQHYHAANINYEVYGAELLTTD